MLESARDHSLLAEKVYNKESGPRGLFMYLNGCKEW